MTAFWNVDLATTLASARKVTAPNPMPAHLAAWLAAYDCDAPTSSNVGASELAFQRWMKFKEAFSPKFVIDALGTLERRPRHCIDPFGGSGTTALTCSLLGIEATTIEVNPFLADLIRAKVTPIDVSELIDAYATVLDRADDVTVNARQILRGAPKSLQEPGIDGRFVFPNRVLARLLALRKAIEEVRGEPTRRMLRVLLGSILIDVSNVVVNGKGRRYRGGWESRQKGPHDVDVAFDLAVRRVVRDLAEFGGRLRAPTGVITGDSRELVQTVADADVSIFSPPYPNSFDYTDVYNLELWILGYLTSTDHNRALRRETLRSHVQIGWDKSSARVGSPTLDMTLEQLRGARSALWNRRLPEMIEAYFQDMSGVLRDLARKTRSGGRIIMVVGDSCYGGVLVDVAAILTEVASDIGLSPVAITTMRDMRNSAQHGGNRRLAESCVVLAP